MALAWLPAVKIRTTTCGKVKSGQLIQSLNSHDEGIVSVAFDPHGRHILSVSADQSMRLWDARKGQAIGTPLRDPIDRTRDHRVNAFFTADGKRILTLNAASMTLQQWDVLDGWRDQLCKKFKRNLTRKEWRKWIFRDIKYMEQCPE